MAERIPLIEPVVGDEELANIREVIESGYMTEGPFARDFEEAFAQRVEAEHAIVATSCTTGLELALEAFGVGPGDEVIIPDFTHPATANVVVRLGAEPVLVDVERTTYNIDVAAVQEGITDRTAAIVPVSWGGQPLDPKPLLELAEANELRVIEDAACTSGAMYGDQPVGSQFDASVFSFHPRKVLTTGEGGMVTLDDDEVAAEIRRIKQFGMTPNANQVEFSRANATNYKLSDVLAAIGVAQLEKLDEIIDRRRQIAHRYTELLEDIEGVTAPVEPERCHHTYQTYAAFIEAGDEETRDQLIEALAEENIETQIGTYALHMTEAFSDASRVGNLEVSRSLYHNLLTLPIAHSMTPADQERVVEALVETIGNS